MNGPGAMVDPRFRLRMAIMNVACAPQAQRRYAQLGMLQRSIETLEAEAPELRRHRDEGVITDAELDALETVQARLAEIPLSDEALGDLEGVYSRDFLFSHALENEAWTKARYAARKCFTLLKAPPA